MMMMMITIMIARNLSNFAVRGAWEKKKKKLAQLDLSKNVFGDGGAFHLGRLVLVRRLQAYFSNVCRSQAQIDIRLTVST